MTRGGLAKIADSLLQVSKSKSQAFLLMVYKHISSNKNKTSIRSLQKHIYLSFNELSPTKSNT
jgi:hypothetical protein